MIVFNEGIPRSGKSYDVMKNHILPALTAGRTVYARLNGLDEADKRQAIADYLKMDTATLDERLVHLTSKEVRGKFLAVQNEDGDWKIPPHLQDSLCVIDECHGFYVASREAINPAIEEFFALIGQNGGDVVLMTQFYKRLHSSVRGRIERKNSFQKLTAVGMDGKYNVTRYHSLAPEKFEKIGVETFSYDPAIFPLYRGYAKGSSNVSVYKAGGTTVWRKIFKYAIFVVPLVALAVYQFTSFFGPDSGLAKSAPPAPVSRSPAVASLDTGQVLPHAGASVEALAHKSHAELKDGQAYVFDLSDKARARLAGTVTMPGRPVAGVVEWRQDAGAVLDRLTLDQLRELGVSVSVHGYGVTLSAGKSSMVVTAWPLDVPAVPPAGDPVAQVDQGRGSTVAQAPESTQWHKRAIPDVYTPPELVQGPGASSWAGR
ncbi:zonular occludens toxin domain-containing protein [Rhodanobacter soli]|uniref:Zona occludens toxin n=1 Tax=Rhodanobacter soli TaxID=590609 RepID=A0ABV2PS13_9GAMM